MLFHSLITTYQPQFLSSFCFGRLVLHQITTILRAAEAGRFVRHVFREHEISEAIYYQWKLEYGGMEPAVIQRLRDREKKINAESLCYRSQAFTEWLQTV